MVKLAIGTGIAVPSEIVLHPKLEGMVTVSPETALATDARRLPEPVSLQLLTGSGAASAISVDAAKSRKQASASGRRESCDPSASTGSA